MRNIVIFLLILTSFLSSSCVKEKFDGETFGKDNHLAPKVDLALVYGTLTSKDLFDQYSDSMKLTPDEGFGITTLVYRNDNLATITSSDYISISKEDNSSVTFGNYSLPEFIFDPISISLYDMKINSTPTPDYYNDIANGAVVDITNQGFINLAEGNRSSENDKYTFIDLVSGKCEVKATNNLNIPVTVKAELWSTGVRPDETQINYKVGDMSFILTSSNTAVNQFDLAGAVLGNKLFLRNIQYMFENKDGVTINLSSDVSIVASIKSAVAKEANIASGAKKVFDAIHSVALPFPDDARISIIDMVGGEMSIKITNNSNMNIRYYATLPMVTQSDEALAKDINISKQSNNNIGFELKNTKMRFSYVTTGNAIQVHQKVEIIPDKGFVYLTATGNLGIEYSITHASKDISNVEGYLGKKVYNITESVIKIPFFDLIPDNLDIITPIGKIYYRNSFSIPIQGNFSIIGTDNSGNTYDIEEGKDKGGVIDFSYPISHLDPVTEVIELNETNSRVREFITGKPSKVTSTGTITFNSEQDNTILNKITPTDSLTVSLHFEIPMYVKFSNIMLRDTLPMRFTLKETVTEEIKGVCIIKNQFPVEMFVEFVLYDKVNKLELGRLVPRKMLLTRPPLLPGGRVDTSKVVSNEVPFVIPERMIDKFKEANSIIVEMKSTTPDWPEGGSKFYSDYKLSYYIELRDLGLDLKL